MSKRAKTGGEQPGNQRSLDSFLSQHPAPAAPQDHAMGGGAAMEVVENLQPQERLSGSSSPARPSKRVAPATVLSPHQRIKNESHGRVERVEKLAPPSDKAYAAVETLYNTKLETRLLPGLRKSLRMAKRKYPHLPPFNESPPTLPTRSSTTSSPLTQQQMGARNELESFMRDHGTVLSESEWGGSRKPRDVLFIQGFPVMTGDDHVGLVMPLLDSKGNVLAKSMRYGEALRLSLEEQSDRIDACLIAGHHARWSGGRQPTEDDVTCMRTVMRLALRCGYDVVVVMGDEAIKIARECCKEQSWDCMLRGVELGWGKEERVMEVNRRSGSATDVPTDSTLVVTTYHPQGAMVEGKAGVQAAINTAKLYDELLAAIRSRLRLIPLDHGAPLEAYGKLNAEGIVANDKLDGGLDSLRLRRSQEEGKPAVPLHQLPGRLRTMVLEDFGVETDNGWEEIVSSGRWSPRNHNVKKPWSPLCYALSVSGVKGGVESTEQCVESWSWLTNDLKYCDEDVRSLLSFANMVEKDKEAYTRVMQTGTLRVMLEEVTKKKSGGGQWEREGAELQGLGKGISNKYLLIECERKDGPKCRWQVANIRDKPSRACQVKCGLKQDGICDEHARQVQNVQRLSTCDHANPKNKRRNVYNGEPVDRSLTPFPGVPLV